ncbi:MAG: hypothetical protein K2K94_07000 [Muribaculaceae bacterium]|nr:hypothetical protein [Muribaculaceae bacterium]
MSDFTLEFLPHYAGNIKRKATFSLYEASWNNYGRWGIFEFQINIPHLIRRVDSLQLAKNHTMRYVGDMIADDNWREWKVKRLYLYERYNNEVLSEIPSDIYFKPFASLCWRLLANFSYEDRVKISNMFHFQFYNQDDKDIFFFKLPLKEAIENGNLPIVADSF